VGKPKALSWSIISRRVCIIVTVTSSDADTKSFVASRPATNPKDAKLSPEKTAGLRRPRRKETILLLPPVMPAVPCTEKDNNTKSFSPPRQTINTNRRSRTILNT
jgi:hypothetical protein